MPITPNHHSNTAISIQVDRSVAARILGHLIDLLSADEALLVLDDTEAASDDLIALHSALVE